MKIEGKITFIKRLSNSIMGNPRYLIIIGGIEYKTKTNAGFVYEINFNNLYNKNVMIEVKKNNIIIDLEIIKQ